MHPANDAAERRNRPFRRSQARSDDGDVEGFESDAELRSGSGDLARALGEPLRHRLRQVRDDDFPDRVGTEDRHRSRTATERPAGREDCGPRLSTRPGDDGDAAEIPLVPRVVARRQKGTHRIRCREEQAMGLASELSLRDPDVVHDELSASAARGRERVADLRSPEGHRDGGVDRRPVQGGGVGSEPGGHVRGHDGTAGGIDRGDDAGREAPEGPVESDPEEGVHDAVAFRRRLRERSDAPFLRERLENEPGVPRPLRVDLRRPAVRARIAEREHPDREAPPGEKARRREPISPVVSGAAHHDDAAPRRETFRDRLRDPARRVLHELDRRGSAADRGAIGRAHLPRVEDGDQAGIPVGRRASAAEVARG